MHRFFGAWISGYHYLVTVLVRLRFGSGFETYRPRSAESLAAAHQRREEEAVESWTKRTRCFPNRYGQGSCGGGETVRSNRGEHLCGTTIVPRKQEMALRAALDLRKQLAAEHWAEPAYQRQVAESYRQLGTFLFSTGRLQEAETAFRAALDIGKKLATEHPTVTEYQEVLAESHYPLVQLA